MAGTDPDWVSPAQVRAAYIVLGLDPDLYDDLVKVEFSKAGVSVKRLTVQVTNQELPEVNPIYAWRTTDIDVIDGAEGTT